MKPLHRGLALLLILALGQASCSFAFVEPPPRRPVPSDDPSGEPQPGVVSCTRRLTAPLVDTAGAAGSLLVTLAFLSLAAAYSGSSDPDSGYDSGAELNAEDQQFLLAIVGLTAGFTASAVWGFMKTSECRERLVTPAPLTLAGEAGRLPSAGDRR